LSGRAEAPQNKGQHYTGKDWNEDRTPQECRHGACKVPAFPAENPPTRRKAAYQSQNVNRRKENHRNCKKPWVAIWNLEIMTEPKQTAYYGRIRDGARAGANHRP
jgi:hypothetical protein